MEIKMMRYSSYVGIHQPKKEAELNFTLCESILKGIELYYLIWYVYNFLIIVGSTKQAGFRSRCTDYKTTKIDKVVFFRDFPSQANSRRPGSFEFEDLGSYESHFYRLITIHMRKQITKFQYV